MRSHSSRKKKVYFFAMVMSRSRMKFVWFIDRRFTTIDIIMTREKAFAFFAGMPKVVVYDLDKTMVVDKNLGEIILTSRFRNYTQERGPELHFCRKAAIAFLSATKKSISALELQRELGHKRYEPIWLMLHKIRSVLGKRDSLYEL